MKHVQSSISSFFVGPANKKQIKPNIHTYLQHTKDEQEEDAQDKSRRDDDVVHESGNISQHAVGGCLEPARFAKWQEGREWLTVSTDGSVKCAACSEVKTLGPNTDEHLHIDLAFVNSVKTSSAKKLNDKINKHGKCQSHVKCLEILQKRRDAAFETANNVSASLWRKKNEERVRATAYCMRTAYMICQNDLSFKMMPQVIELQELNGVDVGSMLHSNKACQSMLMFITQKMASQLVGFITKSPAKFSILIDESTTVSNKTCLIVYIRIPFDGEVCNFFYQLIELELCTGSAIRDTLLDTLERDGITKEMLRSRLIGFATDGAAAMLGRYMGAATLLRDEINPDLTVIHCMNHKLELAVHDVVKHTTDTSHFQMFTDCLYAFFSQSPKHTRELEIATSNLGMHARRIGRVFDVRWLSSSCTSVTALWESYPALVRLFSALAVDTSRSTTERAKCQGIHSQMTQWIFLMELALVKDALETLKALSLFLQRRDATAIQANAEVDIAVRALRSMKLADGANTKSLRQELDTHSFKGVNICQPSDREQQRASAFRDHFFTSLADNVECRLDDNGVLAACAALCPLSWLKDEGKRILFGEDKLVRIQKTLAAEVSDTALLLKELTVQVQWSPRRKSPQLAFCRLHASRVNSRV
ncbi:E3 SUMO-protein ligase KIAA1586-like [Neoarius graeffei]|uniref:E3 SUMO-protein ligase KIAA1586-like n=1 Tax=Neoarius graeffei TaxID=443677 RepID=UPI00298BEB07|nr:E3 SUMO-protein ligase KIAA1586-like [Neoarius graeffei]